MRGRTGLTATAITAAVAVWVVAAVAAWGSDGTSVDGKGGLLDEIVPVVGGTSTAAAPQRGVRYVTGRTGFTGGHVTIEGDRLYVGSYGLGMQIFDISSPASPQHLGGYLPGGRADAPPDAAVYGGQHIAVLNGTNRTTRSLPDGGRTDRTEFLDVTNARAPILLHEFAPSAVGESHNGDIVDARKLWLPSGSGGVNGLRIYDIRPLIGDPGRCRPHDAANPCKPLLLAQKNPVQLWTDSPYRNGRAIGPAYTHTHDVTVYLDYPVAGLGPRDIALYAEGGSYTDNTGNTGSVFVIDITDPANPVALLRWLHARGDGHHPIRYHHEAQFLEGDPRVMLVTDEDLHNGCNAGGVTALRLSDSLTEATELSEWFIESAPAPTCSVHVFTSHGNLVFFGSYNAGLQVVDYSDPAAPRKVGYYIAEGATSWGAQYHEGYVYVGDMSRGLDVLEWTGPKPDLAIAPEDITMSTTRVKGGDSVTFTATVRNVGEVKASGVVVTMALDGEEIAARTVRSIDAGGSASLSATWNAKHQDGDHVLTVTADPADAIDEASETNNRASRSFTVRGNKVANGSFEQSSGGSPESWSGSGATSYDNGGSDGARSVSAGPGGTWTSAPVAVAAGTPLELSVSTAGAPGSVTVEQLSATGAVLSALSVPLSLAGGGTFTTTTASITVGEGVSAVRVVLAGPLVGATTFDDVGLYER